MQADMQEYVCAYRQIYINHIYVYAHMYVYIYACMYVHMCACSIYVYTLVGMYVGKYPYVCR